MIEIVRKETLNNLNGYIKNGEILKDIDNYIVLPELGYDSGLLGAIELGKQKLINNGLQTEVSAMAR